jgi:hypothetical protein
MFPGDPLDPLKPPAQNPQQMQTPTTLEGLFLQEILKRIAEQPPQQPVPQQPKGFFDRMAPRAYDIKAQQYAMSPEYINFQNEQRKHEESQKILGQLLGASGDINRGNLAQEREDRLGRQFNTNLQMNRFEERIINYNDPQQGNVALRTLYDKMTDTHFDARTMQPIDVSRLNMPIHQMQYAGPGGEPVTFTTSQLPQTPQVPIAGGASAGAPGITNVPRPTEGGGQASGAQPSNMLTQPRMARRGLAPHQPPAGVTQDASRAISFVQSLAPIFDAWRQAKSSVSGVTGSGVAGTAGQLAIDRAAQTQGVRAFLPFAIGNAPAQAAIDYKQKQKIALYNYVKQQTGAQFSVTEMDRYESMFPRIEDSEDTALNSLSNLAQKAVNDINALKLQWHAIQTPSGPIYVKPDYMQEFLSTGGMPQETQPTDPAEAILQKHLSKKRGAGGNNR